MIDDGKVGDYEVLSSLRVGMKTIFLCENVKASEGQKYGCGFAERDDLFERYSEIEVSDDYMEIVKLYSDRINDEVQAMEAELSELDVPLSVIEKDECYPNDFSALKTTGSTFPAKMNYLLGTVNEGQRISQKRIKIEIMNDRRIKLWQIRSRQSP